MKKNFGSKDQKSSELLHSDASPSKSENLDTFVNSVLLDGIYIWKTCLREIIFCDSNFDSTQLIQKLSPDFEKLEGLDAECFLAEVLCGLKSPLIGETEVFGQFKNWWKEISETSEFKNRNKKRIDLIFCLVKTVREKALCGQGSQSYGSILRKRIQAGETVDIVGAGHLAQEIIPWLTKHHSVRLWVREPRKVLGREEFKTVSGILPLIADGALSKSLVVAAPISHDDLSKFLIAKGMSSKTHFFDLRADSDQFQVPVQTNHHLRLQDFASRYLAEKSDIEKSAQQARDLISRWKVQQQEQAQVRPFGWDDL